MPFQQAKRVKTRIAEIEMAGGTCGDYYMLLERLRWGQSIAPRHNDHALTGTLRGLRSIVVGNTGDGDTVIAVYQVVERVVAVAIVDEHDKAYETLREEKLGRRRHR